MCMSYGIVYMFVTFTQFQHYTLQEEHLGVLAFVALFWFAKHQIVAQKIVQVSLHDIQILQQSRLETDVIYRRFFV